MSQKPFVSILMPTYNAEKYLRESVLSILNQTFQNFELLIIDDESTDRTREIMEEYAGRDSRIKLLNGPKRGIAAALNYGIDQSRGDYIARMDADDLSLPERIQIQVNIMEKNKEIGVCSSLCMLYYCNGELKENPICPPDHQAIQCFLLFSNPITHSSVVMRKSILGNDVRYDENVVAEDYHLWTRLICITQFYCVQEPLIHFRWDNQEKLTTVKEKAVQKSAVDISRNYIRNLFHIDLQNYLAEDFYPIWSDFTYPGGVERYLFNQYSLLRNIYMNNEKSGAVQREILEDHLNDRWQSALLRWGFLLEWNHLNTLKISREDLSRQLQESTAVLNHFINYKTRVLIYGMGIRGRQLLEKYERLKNKYSNVILVGVADKKAGQLSEDSYPVMYPDEIQQDSFDYIVISSNKYYTEIVQELMARNIERTKIMNGSIFDVLLMKM